ncbi:hypothetical protein ACFO1B_15255 [Dactylosporangium siamense]|uniref:Double-GTPase 2 domain-containing protein n=1 Tax=Dactylosporangium siamense TaxID=685454 RepID=A0A919UC09_9ACTN|nr:hypothetical protein [Dactylosporangium siamense]GIG45193.1 hypothetical protein Dsi01nite_032340 [Dactylosporangium siamense]
MDYTVRRVCPFCGEVIVLNRCSIRATNAPPPVEDPYSYPDPVEPPPEAMARPARAAGLAALQEFESETATPRISRRPEPRAMPPAPRRPAEPSLTDVLWSWRAPRAPDPVRRGRWFTPPPPAYTGEYPLVPLNTFPPERMARRFCSNPQCDSPLPMDLDERQAHIVSIVGLTAAGKTYYLTTAFNEAMNGDGLDAAGFREFEPDEETARHFYTNYYNHVYRDNTRLQSTPEKTRANQQPLNFRAHIDGGRPMLVMTHDIAGETLMDHVKRAQNAGFLRRSSGLIFLVDPLEFDAVRARVPREQLPRARSIHQRDLLAATLRELDFEPGRRKVPVTVVISKADLLAQLFPGGARLLDPGLGRVRSQEAWLQAMQESSAYVRSLLIELGQQRLVRTAEQYGRVSFHAVSAIGATPGPNGEILPSPRRVLDPLAVVLWRLSTALR